MGIPAARQRLLDLADELEASNPFPRYGAKMIRKIIDEEMFRAAPGKPISRRKLPALTDDQIRLIKKQVELRPDMSLLEVANLFGTNPGRVSEAINGKV